VPENLSATNDLVRNSIDFAILNSIFALGGSVILAHRHQKNRSVPYGHRSEFNGAGEMSVKGIGE